MDTEYVTLYYNVPWIDDTIPDIKKNTILVRSFVIYQKYVCVL